MSTQAKDIREKMSALNLEIAALRDAPVSLEDFRKYLLLWIEHKGKAYADKCFLHSVLADTDSFSALNKRPFSELESTAGSRMFWPFPRSSELNLCNEPMLNALCFFMPELVFEKLLLAMQEHYGQRWGNADAMPIEQRVARLEVLNREVSKLRPDLNAIESEISKISGLIADASY